MLSVIVQRFNSVMICRLFEPYRQRSETRVISLFVYNFICVPEKTPVHEQNCQLLSYHSYLLLTLNIVVRSTPVQTIISNMGVLLILVFNLLKRRSPVNVHVCCNACQSSLLLLMTINLLIMLPRSIIELLIQVATRKAVVVSTTTTLYAEARQQNRIRCQSALR